MTFLLSLSMLLAFVWPMAAQDSISAPMAPGPDTPPIQHTQQAMLSTTRASSLTDVPLVRSTRRPAYSQAVKRTASSGPAEKATLLVGTQSFKRNHGPTIGADPGISHAEATLTSGLAGPLSAEVRGGLASTLPPATEPLVSGTSSLREEPVGPTDSPPASPSLAYTQGFTGMELVTTKGTIESPTEDVTSLAGSGNQIVVVSKEMEVEDSPVSVAVSPLPPWKLTSTSGSALTGMAEAQPRPTASIVLSSVSTPTSPKTSAPPADPRSAGDRGGTAAATTMVLFRGPQPGSETKTPPVPSAGSTHAPAVTLSSAASGGSLQPPATHPTLQQAPRTSTTLTDISTATTSRLAKETVPRGPTVTRAHKMIWLTDPGRTSTTSNGKRTRTALTPSPGPVIREGAAPEKKKNASVSMVHIPPPVLHPPSPSFPPAVPCTAGREGCVAPGSRGATTTDEAPGPNGTSPLEWSNLSRMLSFAWELHVYGSAALFALLAAGGALGLALAPSPSVSANTTPDNEARWPSHRRGALLLCNALLGLAGALRAALFLIDPYGSRRRLPQAAVTALLTLPLPLLLWAQVALTALVLLGSASMEVATSALPPAVLRPPLQSVLAVLQCTLLLAADLLSPALSPVVPLALQGLTVLAGLALCLGYLCLALRRLAGAQHAQQPRGGGGKAGGDKGGWLWRTLSRALAACALLGALCCALHAHTCLWLYGALGDRQHFSWGWWLGAFWARLLELAWAFGLLLLASQLFWRPRRGGAGAGTAGGAGASASGGGELSSPSQTTGSSASSRRPHTCWAKIMQSLKGRPAGRKSENAAMGAGTNGVGGASGGGSGGGELPNNWAGQERSASADISKSLIRNREPKDSNRSRQQQGSGGGAGGGAGGGGGSLVRLQALSRSPGSSLDHDKESSWSAALSLCDFDLRPPSPIDLSRSIDEALHREHLLRGGSSLFRPLRPAPGPASPEPPPSPGPWLRRNSDPSQLSLSDSSGTALTESSAGLDRVVDSSVPSRQVTAPPTPTHQGPRWASERPQVPPSSLSCPVSLRPSRSSLDRLTPAGGEDTRPFLTPDPDGDCGSGPDSSAGKRYLRVSGRQDDSASVSSDIIDL